MNKKTINGYQQNIKMRIPYIYRNVTCGLVIDCEIISGYIHNNFESYKSYITIYDFNQFMEKQKDINVVDRTYFFRSSGNKNTNKVNEKKIFFSSTIDIEAKDDNRTDGITKVWNELKRIIDEIHTIKISQLNNTNTLENINNIDDVNGIIANNFSLQNILNNYHSLAYGIPNIMEL
jgi:hypothetical protein